MGNFVLFYLGAFICYYSYAYITYHQQWKNSPWFMPAGLALALIGNLLWMSIARAIKNHHKLFLAGVAFDLIVTTSFIITPFVFFGLRLRPLAWVGLLFAGVGLFLMKVSVAGQAS